MSESEWCIEYFEGALDGLRRDSESLLNDLPAIAERAHKDAACRIQQMEDLIEWAKRREVERDEARRQRDELIAIIGVHEDGESQDPRPWAEQWQDILTEVTTTRWDEYLNEVRCKLRNEMEQEQNRKEIGGEG